VSSGVARTRPLRRKPVIGNRDGVGIPAIRIGLVDAGVTNAGRPRSDRRGAANCERVEAEVVARARRQVTSRLENVTLQLSFVRIAVNPKDRERHVARELAIRLKGLTRAFRLSVLL